MSGDLIRWRVVKQNNFTLEPYFGAVDCNSPAEVGKAFAAGIQECKDRRENLTIVVFQKHGDRWMDVCFWNSNNREIDLWRPDYAEPALCRELERVANATGMDYEVNTADVSGVGLSDSSGPTLEPNVLLQLIVADNQTGIRNEETISATPTVVGDFLIDGIRRRQAGGLNQNVAVRSYDGQTWTTVALWGSKNSAIDVAQDLGDTPVYHLLIRAAEETGLRVKNCTFGPEFDAPKESATPIPSGFADYFLQELPAITLLDLGAGQRLVEETVDERFEHFLRESWDPGPESDEIDSV